MTRILCLFLLFLGISCSSSQDPIVTNTFNLGLEQMKLAEYHNAARSFREVIKYSPTHIDAHNNLGIVYAAIGEFENAEKTFLNGLKLNPKHTQLKFNLGQLYKNMKRYLAAEKLFIESAQDEDFFDRPKVLYELGDMYQNLGRKNEAISMLERSVKLDGSSCQSHFLLGKIYRSTGKFTEAINSFNQASTGACVRNRTAMLFLAETHYQAGNKPIAKATWEKVVRLFSGESVAKLAEQKLKTLQF